MVTMAREIYATPQQFPFDRKERKAALLSAVERIREVATRYAHEAEAHATLPAAVVDALSSSGLWTMKLPAALGGAEADPVTQIEVIEALSAIEPSVGWCLMVGATSIGLPGAFLPDTAVSRMFAKGPPRGAAVAMPAGTAVPALWISVERPLAIRKRRTPCAMGHPGRPCIAG